MLLCFYERIVGELGLE